MLEPKEKEKRMNEYLQSDELPGSEEYEAELQYLNYMEMENC